ncbi:MAG: hypothetical protein RMN52_02360 [Anaerolineae bacterium]|nr:hypothetical protein [Candidatus Roseilinea sp.]MDW8448824.1 hypothetical protein [Anaerolineae bacterium]
MQSARVQVYLERIEDAPHDHRLLRRRRLIPQRRQVVERRDCIGHVHSLRRHCQVCQLGLDPRRLAVVVVVVHVASLIHAVQPLQLRLKPRRLAFVRGARVLPLQNRARFGLHVVRQSHRGHDPRQVLQYVRLFHRPVFRVASAAALARRATIGVIRAPVCCAQPSAAVRAIQHLADNELTLRRTTSRLGLRARAQHGLTLFKQLDRDDRLMHALHPRRRALAIALVVLAVLAQHIAQAAIRHKAGIEAVAQHCVHGVLAERAPAPSSGCHLAQAVQPVGQIARRVVARREALEHLADDGRVLAGHVAPDDGLRRRVHHLEHAPVAERRAAGVAQAVAHPRPLAGLRRLAELVELILADGQRDVAL